MSAKCKTRGCRHRAATKNGAARLYGYCGGCYALGWAFAGLPDPPDEPQRKKAGKR